MKEMERTKEDFYDYNGSDEDKIKHKFINDDRKRFTKSAIVRLEYKTRYNTSKIVIFSLVYIYFK